MAAPPVSVASVRVSLIVRTAQRIAAGAWARCSVWLMQGGADPRRIGPVPTAYREPVA